MIRDAIAVLNADSSFSFDGLTVQNGEVLATNVLFAGPTSGVWSEGLWPHQWSMNFPKPTVRVNGVTRLIDNFQITNVENSPKIGTFVHENGHLILDYPDLYDYGGDSDGVGDHCVMAGGSNANREGTPNAN